MNITRQVQRGQTAKNLCALATFRLLLEIHRECEASRKELLTIFQQRRIETTERRSLDARACYCANEI
jgi:hypothetical protein